MKTLMQTLFGRVPFRSPAGVSLRIPGLRQARDRRRAGPRLLYESERLEPRYAFDVGVLEYVTSVDQVDNSIRYPGRVYVASNNASDVFLQRVASSPEDLLVADNGSFLNNRVVNGIQKYDSMLVTNGVRRVDTVEANQWWLFPNNTTRLALGNNDGFLFANSVWPSLQVGEYLFGNSEISVDLSGSIRYTQADGVESVWTFTAWDGERVRTRPSELIISSGPGYASRETSEADRSIRLRPELQTGYIYPVSVRPLFNGLGEHLEIEWSALPVRPPIVAANYTRGYVSVNNILTSLDQDSSIGTAANPLVEFELPGARSATYDGSNQQVSLGVIPGTLTGSVSIGSLSASLADRVAVDGSTSLLLNGTQADVLEDRRFISANNVSIESYFIGTGSVGTHSVSVEVTRDESDDDFFFPESFADTHRDHPFAGWNVNTAIGQSVTATVSYLVFARDPQPNTVTFAPGLDIANEVTVDLLVAGSTLNVNSPITVSVTSGDIDLRATNININAPVSTPDRMYIGRSQTHVNQPRLLLPLEAGDYDDGLLDTPTFNPLRAPGNVAKQVIARAEVSPDGAVRRLVVLPGDEGYGYDVDNPPAVYVGTPAPQRGSVEVTSLSGIVTRVAVDSGGAGYKNGANALASTPEFGFIESVRVIGEGDYLINGVVPQAPPLVIIDEPSLLDPDRIGSGRRAEATAAVDPVTGGVAVTVTDGGFNYERAPAARVATFLEASVEAIEASGGNQVLTLEAGFRDSEFLVPGMPVVVNGVDSGESIQAVTALQRQVTVPAAVPIDVGDLVRFYLNQQYLDNVSDITPAGAANGNLGYDTATFNVSTADGEVVGVFVVNPGSGYKAAPTVTITAQPSDAGEAVTPTAVATATASIAGGVAEAVVNLRGSNYREGDLGPIAVTGTGGGGGAITLTVENGSIVGGRVTSAGQGYRSAATINEVAVPAPPPLTADQLEGRAAFRAVVEPDGSVRQFELIRSGANYTDPPQVSVAAPLTPTSASATSRIDAAAGSVRQVVVGSPGLLYAWTPRVSIAPPPAGSGGVRARAQAFLDDFGRVERIDIIDPGSGYESRPDVWVEPQGRFTVVESLKVGASLAANIYEIYVGDDAATPLVPKGLVDLSPEATFGGEQLRLAVADSQGEQATTRSIKLDLGTGDSATAINFGAISGMTITGNGIAPGTTVAGFNAKDSTFILSQELDGTPSGQVTVDQRGAAMFLEAAAADINLGGRLDVTTQSYLLASTAAQQATGPFEFVTRASGNDAFTGRISGSTMAVTLGNDLLVPTEGGVLENIVDLDTSVGSLRMTAAESEDNPRGPFPYRISIREEDDVGIDAAIATSGEISLAAGGDLALTTAINTYGGITLRSDNLSVTSRLTTRFGAIDIEGKDLRIANSLEVTSVSPNSAVTDIRLRATEGGVFLQGNVSAVNKIVISQDNPADGPALVYGPATVRGGELLLQAEGNVALSTDVDSLRGFGGQTVSISELDNISIPSLQILEGGTVSLVANGSDRGAAGVNPIALRANIFDASRVAVAAPNGSIDITADAIGDIELGDLRAISEGDAEPLLAAGNVTIRSRAGDVVVFDAPAAATSARAVDYVTNEALPVSTYIVSTSGLTASYIDGEGSLNDYKAVFGNESGPNFKVGDRILVKNQVDKTVTSNIDEARENGVYVVTRVGGGVAGYRDWRLTRATDSLRSEDLPAGSYVKVRQLGLADDVYWVNYTDDLAVSVEQTLTNQLVLPESFGSLGALRVNQSVVGSSVANGAVITSIDHDNRVVTLGLQNRVAVELRDEAGGQVIDLVGEKPLLMQAISSALADGEQVIVSGKGLLPGARVSGIIDATLGVLGLSPGSLEAGNQTSDVTFGFVSAASGRRVLNPAVRTFMLAGQVLSSTSNMFTVSRQFSNFDALYVGQPIFGDGVLPDTRITRLNPANREVFVSPGGLAEQLPGPSRFESDSPAQVFRSRFEEAVATGSESANEFVALDQFTFFNYDLFTDDNLRSGRIVLEGDLFNGGTATVRGFDAERGRVFLDPDAQAFPGDVGDVTVLVIGGGRYETNAVETGVIENYDYLVFDEDVLPNVPAAAAIVSGAGLSEGARVLRTLVDGNNSYGFGVGARITILTPNAVFTPTDVEFVSFSQAGTTPAGPLEAGRYEGAFSGDLLRFPATFSGLNLVQVGDPVSGPSIRPDTFVEGVDLELGVIAVTRGGVNDENNVPFVEVNRNGQVIVGDVVAASSRLAVSSSIRGEFEDDRIYLRSQSDEFAQLQVGASVQGPGIASDAVITGFDPRTGLIGLSRGALEDPSDYRDETGGRITLAVNLPIAGASESPSGFHSRDFERYIVMEPDFAEYDRIHIGQNVQGFDATGTVAFSRFVTAIDPLRRYVGLSEEPLVQGVGQVRSVLFKAAESISFGLTAGQGSASVKFVGNSFGSAPIEVLNPVRLVGVGGVALDEQGDFDTQSVILNGFTDWDILDELVRAAARVGDLVQISGSGLASGTEITGLDIGASKVSLSKSLLQDFLDSGGAAAELKLNFHGLDPELRTAIGSDQESAEVRFVVASAGGTNDAAGGLGKTITLFQQNDLSESNNPQQRQELLFWDGLEGTIELQQVLPEITSPIVIDGNSRFSSPADLPVGDAAPIVINGAGVLVDDGGKAISSSDAYDGFRFVGGAGGAVLRNVTIGGFFNGSAVRVNNVPFVSLDSLKLGLDEAGRRAVNLSGVTVAGAEARFTTVTSSTITGAVRAGVVVDNNAADARLVGNTFGTAEVPSEIGVAVVSSDNSVGVRPILDATLVLSNGVLTAHGEKTLLAANGLAFGDVVPGMGVFVSSADGSTLFNGESIESSPQNVAEIIGVDSISGQVLIDGEFKALGSSVQVSVGHLIRGTANTAFLELPATLTVDDLYIGQSVSGDGIPSGAVIKEINRGSNGQADTVQLSGVLTNNGFNRTGYRRVRFGQPAGSGRRNVFTNNRYGVQFGFSAEASASDPSNRVQLSATFSGWENLAVGTEVRGPGIPAETTVIEVSEASRSILLSKPVTETFARRVLAFEGGDMNRIVNSTFDGNLYSGVLVTGGQEHLIGGPVSKLSLSDGSELDASERVELASFEAIGVEVASDEVTLTMPQNYAVRSDALQEGMRVYGPGIPEGTVIESVTVEQVSAVGDPLQTQIVSVVVSQAVSLPASGTTVRVSFGLGRFLSAADADGLTVGMGVNGIGVVDYTVIEQIVSPRVRSGVIVLSTPDPVMSENYPNSRFRLDLAQELVFVARDSSSNEFINNERYGIEAVEAAFRGWNDVTDPVDALIAGWLVAGNKFDVDRENVAGPNGLGGIDPGLNERLGAGEFLERGFDKVDLFGNQYGVQVPPTEAETPLDPDTSPTDPSEPTDPGGVDDGSNDEYTPTDPRIPIVRF